ncbi:c-type cytochrome [Pontibacter rugosus]
MRRLFILAATTFLLLSLSFCGTARRGAPKYEPLNTDNPAVAQGEVVFMTYCQKCHPGGASGLAPAINNKPLPGFMIRFQVRHGVGTMPLLKKM